MAEAFSASFQPTGSRPLRSRQFAVPAAAPPTSPSPTSYKHRHGEAVGVSKSPPARSRATFGGAGVLELVSDFQTDTYRAVYTVRFGERAYVLHALQKKSKKGTATLKSELDLLIRSLR